VKRTAPAAAAAAAGAAGVALLLLAVPLSAAAEPPAAERFEVLQALFHPLASPGWTRQGLDERCVLMEQRAEGGSPPEAEARAAADALLGNTTRRQLCYAEFGHNESRFPEYYRSTTVPSAVFDGTARVSGGGPQALLHAQAAYDEAERVAPRASLNVSSGSVITAAHVDYEVFAPEAFAGYTVAVRALIVEDLVDSAEAGRELRYLVRLYLPGDRVELGGNASIAGRLNFSLAPSWVEGRLAAVVFVQIDTPPPSPPIFPSTSFDLVGALLVPAAVLATGAAMALLVARAVRRERRAKLR
jgi:hypothetical protein